MKDLKEYRPKQKPTYLFLCNKLYLPRTLAKDTINKPNQNGFNRNPAITSYKTTLNPVNTRIKPVIQIISAPWILPIISVYKYRFH